MAKLVCSGANGGRRVGWVTADGIAWVAGDALTALELGGPAAAGAEPEVDALLAPLEPPEVWAAGVTYERSRRARVEESQVQDVYSLVYDAERPEIFLKDAGGRRTVGPGGTIGVRSDGLWTVPEPEVALVLGRGGRILGATAANDVTARDIEGSNPLYLPQAKIFAGACAIGPAVLTPDEWPDPFVIRCTIVADDGAVLWEGETSTDQMRRSFDELVSWLVRENPIPAGSLLLTGTGLVPPDDVALAPGQRVDIAITGIGTLTNMVGTAADVLSHERSTVNVEDG
jgi:2-dehydro-3-deoxy-D-arabinonate dehydratase